MQTANDLAGRACIVTGASRGLGAAIARKLWARGADLLLVARSDDALEQLARALAPQREQRVRWLACDLAQADAPARIVGEAERALGRVSVLVNNAAVQGPIGNAWENDWAEWEQALRVNLLSAVDLARRCVAPMAAAGGGKIISISGGGATTPRARFTAYGTAKAALVRFSETLAEEVRHLGIDVNCVAPGAMGSAMTEAVLAAGRESAGEKEYEAAARIAAAPADRTIERAADLCAFLASRASDGITGKLIAAQWDPWETFPDRLEQLRTTDLYTLRRIVPKDRGLD